MIEEKKEELSSLYNLSFKEVKEGEIVKGKIVKISPKDVLIDIGYKSEGIVAREEFAGQNDLVSVKRSRFMSITSKMTMA